MKSAFKWISALILGMAVFIVAGCKSESKIDNVPVSEIEPSEPPAESVQAKLEPVYDVDGVFKISEKRYFNAVVPFGATEISCSADECRCFVPRMVQDDVVRFFEKYFPYQEHGIFRKVDIFEVNSKIRDEYADDSIIPNTNPNILKPSADTAVEIHVFWNQREKHYEWTYIDPLKRVREREADEALQARMREEAEAFEASRQIKRSDDSDGDMVNANEHNVK